MTGRQWVQSPVLLVLVLTGSTAAVWLPLLSHAPNRIVAGQSIGLAALIHGWALPLAVPAILLVAGPFLPRRRWTQAMLAVCAALLATGMLALASLEAGRLARLTGPIARTSFGGGFWALELASWLVFAEAIRRCGLATIGRILAAAAAFFPVLLLISSGVADELSLMREYAARRDVFFPAVLQHLEIVGLALLPAIVLGLPLGLLAFRRRRWQAVLLTGLNIVQTIPSIALFGLLFVPLAGLAGHFPGLARQGLGATGLAPAIIALILYSLLPIVRSTLAGLGQVPGDAVDAATGLGMTPRQIFCLVELPLALPPILSGLRVAIVQAIGLTAVAALIGAGGLGALMFQGLLASALDQVLLAVLPMVGLAVMADAVLRLVVGVLEIRRQ